MKLENMVKEEAVELSKYSVFVGYGYMQHAGNGKKGKMRCGIAFM